ncbi:hypothetical protein BCR39DRAFT_519218 [Naematelia encephala]|uniref:Uncharacterized protein n=1 Tax=Naematelia encephala TaxID=71784 RepID=A0A1Y2BG53_9TREE|nr:hypothetical protein BCR39DRAFT_519218 [Naematelia encephala]
MTPTATPATLPTLTSSDSDPTLSISPSPSPSPTRSSPIMEIPTGLNTITSNSENRRRKTVSELAAEFRIQIPPAPRSPPFRPGSTRRQREDDYRMQFREDVGAGYGGWFVPGIDSWPPGLGIREESQVQRQTDQDQQNQVQHLQEQWLQDHQDQYRQGQWRQESDEEREQQYQDRHHHYQETEVDVVRSDEEWVMLDDEGQSSVGLQLGGEDNDYNLKNNTSNDNDNNKSGGDDITGGDNDRHQMDDESQRHSNRISRPPRLIRGESAGEEDGIGSENAWEIITSPRSRTNTTHAGSSRLTTTHAGLTRPSQRRTGLHDCSAEILGRITSYVDQRDLWNLLFVNRAMLQEAGRAIYSSDRVQNIPLRQLLEGIQTARPDFQHPFGRNLKLSLLSHVKVIQHTLGQRNENSLSRADEDQDDAIIDMLDNLPSSVVIFPRLDRLVLKGNNFLLSLRLISRSKPKAFCWSSDFSTDLAGTDDLPFSELRFPDGHIPESVCTHNVDSWRYPIPCYGTLNRVEIRPRSDLQGENAQGRASFVAGILRLAHPELKLEMEDGNGDEQEIQKRKREETKWEFAHLCTTTMAFVVQEPGLNPVGLRTEVPRLVRDLIPEMKDRILITRNGNDGECAACGKQVTTI